MKRTKKQATKMQQAEKLKKENGRLREAVQRRNTELEEKKRELEIEAALEKVRAVALAMKNREDMLRICTVIAQQLAQLGLAEIRNVQTAIFYPEKHSYMNYEYYARHRKTFITDTTYNNHPIAKAFAQKMLRGKGQVSITHIRGKQKVREWLAYQKTTNVFIDTELNKADSLSYYWHSLGPVALGISTYVPLSKEELELFGRFLRVFELAYRRYLDIEKAGEQAREARIEASLERIRAAAMAMRDSSALGGIIYKLYTELTQLDARLDRAFIMIVNPENQGITWWMAGYEGLLAENGFFVPFNQHPTHLLYLDHCKKRKKKWTYLFEGKEKRDWDRFGFSKTELARLPEPIKKFMAAAKRVYLSGSSDQFGSLVTGSFEPLPQEQQDIISRFAIVFNQAYTRFLDLQKAEAQAREAQIEAALERVRSRTMLMQQSRELNEAAELLYRELGKLGIPIFTCGYVLMNEKTDFGSCYMANPEGSFTFEPFRVSQTGNPVFRSIYRSWKNKENYCSIRLEGEENIAHNRYLAEESDKFPLPVDLLLSILPPVTVSNSFNFNMGYLLVVSLSPYTNEQTEVLVRFARVFEQTYTRFLDLQKAEAQAREAEIELALERVRARTMAMHKSDELKEVIQVVLSQFIQLHINVGHAGFYIDYRNQEDMHIWLADPNLEPFFAVIPYFDSPTWNSFLTAKASKTTLHTDLLDFKEKNKFYRSLFKLFTVPDEAKKFYLQCRGLAVSTVLLDNIGLYIENFDALPYTDEEHAILIRFAKVFEQTYTRFLDLQKAESQAREAQIEASLERVRARTMAMHKSDELSEVSALLYNELQGLGVTRFINCGYVEINETVGIQQAWMTIADGSGVDNVQLPLTGDPVFDERYDAWKRKEQVFHQSVGGDLLKSHIEFGTQHYRNTEVDKMVRARFADPTLFYCSNFSHGYLHIVTNVPLSAEDESLLTRFTRVFEMTYKRFLDLQKAEAQAREAQIEAALEKVRSKTMAMQRSEELPEAANNLFLQVQALGIPAWSAGYCIWLNEDRSSALLNMSSEGVLQKPFSLPSVGVGYDFLSPVQKGDQFYVAELGGEKLVRHYEFMRTLPVVGEVLDGIINAGFPLPTFQVFHIIYFTHGYLMFITYEPVPDAHDIFKRFGVVFEQTYTRFLDLQKAEAQAKEAQIEAALERVRARTMAMHQSDELSDCAELLFSELSKLGGSLWSSGFAILKENEEEDGEYRTTDQFGTREEVTYIPNAGDPTMHHLYQGWRQGKTYISYDLAGEEIRQHYENMLALPKSGQVFQAVLDAGQAFPDWQQMHAAYFKQGYLLVISLDEYKESDLLIRFAKVFEQTYTRFLDLKKAEAQAREAEIQLALERVRARSLAMHQTSELQEVVNEVAQQLLQMKIDMDGGIFIIINDEAERDIPLWGAAGAADYISKSTVPFLDRPIYTRMLEAIRKRESFLAERFNMDEKNEFLTHMFRYPPWSETPEKRKKELLARMGDYCRSIAISRHTSIGMTNHHGKAFSEEENAILRRFGNVLEQSYTRFLDLQKAEAQARESQIQLALERVRARTMAMQRSEELQETSLVLFQQLKELGEPAEQCTVGIIKESEGVVEISATFHGNKMPQTFRHKIDEPFVMRKLFRGWKDQQKTLVVEIKGKELQLYNQYRNKLIGKETFPVELLPGDCWIVHLAYFSEGMLALSTNEPRPAESLQILERFAKVFGQAFTRFLDLQKAEAQAKEAQIEAALERVRSRTMAMQKSDELPETSFLLFQQVKELGITTLQNSIGIVNEPEGFVELSTTVQGHPLTHTLHVPVDDPYVMVKAVAAWKAKRGSLNLEFTGQELKEYNAHRNSILEMKVNFPEDRWVVNIFFFSKGWLSFSTNENISAESVDFLQRFATVFEQTYTRFNDLKQAEAQTREAQIEAALERVRSRSLAMHSSGELGDVVTVVLNNLMELGYIIDEGSAAHLVIFSEGTKDFVQWSADPALPQPVRSFIPYTDLPILTEFWDARQKGHDFFARVYSFDEKNTWFKFAFAHSDLKHIPGELKKLLLESESYGHSIAIEKNSAIIINSITGNQLLQNQIDILKRFSKVFEQAYVRFLDLQKAEAQAREAEIELALERVRAKTMAMHSSQDVEAAVFTLFDELLRLGINKTLRCGIGVLQDRDHLELWTATSGDGNKVILYKGKLDIDIHPMLQGVREAWESKAATYFYLLEGADLVNYYTAINAAPEYEFRIDISQLPPKLVHSDFFFPEGTLFTFTLEPIAESDQRIFKRFAAVFGQTYRRFLDLQQAEALAQQAEIDLVRLKEEKKKTEEALAELRTTQNQLIQAEKMASLGELTAGIAHEIQNPLNFVNNFSEVSTELITEMKEELDKGNTEDALAIAEDLRQNLEKINHHGKRADSIVKGMLQHSRTSSGQKELTDINALCDEYVRLAYHGLRAKDKSFNAKYETDFDPTLEKISVIPQEIGRVVLNLLNNAFQAPIPLPPKGGVKDSKSKHVTTVCVSTKKTANGVLINVRDNGAGIPEKILDKIFQPFFTTKPAGQGTGLGLSLSYDIVKAHGGEIKVETKEGEGTVFTIQLPTA